MTGMPRERGRRWVLQAGAMVLSGGTSSPGFVIIEGDRIAGIQEGRHPDPDLDFPDGTVAPGFVDLQINGAAGCDFLSPTETGLTEAHAYLLRTGTVAYLPTLITSPEKRLRAALAFFAEHAPPPVAPRILGVHLEGPFLSPVLPGAHRSEYLLPPSIEWIGRLVEDFQGLIRIMTLAPELDGALELIDWLAARRIIAAVGHTDATFAEATAAFERGARLATHLFNAMRPTHHREPGVVGAALAHPQVVCSIIADLVHLHPAVIQLVTARKGPDRIALITDAIAAAGAATQDVTLGDQAVRVVNGAPRLADGTLAGSVLAMDQAVRNMVSAGHRLDQAVQMASTTPAALLSLAQGELRVGLRADLAVLDSKLAVTAVVVGGVLAHTAA